MTGKAETNSILASNQSSEGPKVVVGRESNWGRFSNSIRITSSHNGGAIRTFMEEGASEKTDIVFPRDQNLSNFGRVAKDLVFDTPMGATGKVEIISSLIKGSGERAKE